MILLADFARRSVVRPISGPVSHALTLSLYESNVYYACAPPEFEEPWEETDGNGIAGFLISGVMRLSFRSKKALKEKKRKRSREKEEHQRMQRKEPKQAIEEGGEEKEEGAGGGGGEGQVAVKEQEFVKQPVDKTREKTNEEKQRGQETKKE